MKSTINSEKRPVVRCCEHGCEPLDSTESGGSLDYLSDKQNLKSLPHPVRTCDTCLLLIGSKCGKCYNVYGTTVTYQNCIQEENKSILNLRNACYCSIQNLCLPTGYLKT
jgi:hypothetical protein